MTIDQTIAEELEAFRDIMVRRDGESSEMNTTQLKKSFMNNFYMYFLPEDETALGKIRVMKDFGTWEQSYEKGMRQACETSEEAETCLQKNSALYRSQTGQEFLDALRKACEMRGRSFAEVQQRAIELRDARDTTTTRNGSFVEDILFPIFIEARRMGYTHEELRS